MLRSLPNFKVLGDNAFTAKMQAFQVVPRRYVLLPAPNTLRFAIFFYPPCEP